MASQKLQVGRALRVIPSDNANIPFPALVCSGENDGFDPNILIDTTVNFIALNVNTGDIIYNTTDNTAATIINVLDENTLELNADIYQSIGLTYFIYSGDQNNGCVLYIGGSGPVHVLTVGEDDVTFVGVNTGQFMPVQVLKVFASSTEATYITALW